MTPHPPNNGAARERSTTSECTVDGCTKPAERRGWCLAHYSRWRRNGSPTGGRVAVSNALEWVHEHKHHSSDDCLLWPFGRTQAGYGKMRDGCRNVRAHRMMCELRNGPPPTTKSEAAHNCGNGHLGCVNPRHLRWATRNENAADTIVHGTSPRGERNGLAKLTAVDVVAIRTSSESRLQLARRFGVHKATIDCIIWRKRWSWLAA